MVTELEYSIVSEELMVFGSLILESGIIFSCSNNNHISNLGVNHYNILWAVLMGVFYIILG